MKKNKLSLLSDEEMSELRGGFPWYYAPVAWVLTEIAMNPKTTSEVYYEAASDELEKIKAEHGY